MADKGNVPLGAVARLLHRQCVGPLTTIDDARPGDAAAIAELYAHHVLHGTATFETVPPDATEMAERLAKVTGAGWPWLVARGSDGAVVGYAYAAQLRERAAYRFACENSIYIRDDARGQRIGTALMERLLPASTTAGFRQMFAVIAGTEPASIALHTRFGFAHCGLLKAAGRKFGRWIDVVYMQAALGEGDTTPPPVEPA